jgi:hypothetical protein
MIPSGTQQLAEKLTREMKNIPQRLKPRSIRSSYGTTQGVPFQNGEFFRKL